MLLATPAEARPLDRAEKKAIGQRIARVVNYRRTLKVEEGDTIFVVRRVKLPKSKISGDPAEYEGIVSSVRTPKGIEVDERIDEVKIRPVRKDRVEITFRYALSALPGTTKGGEVNLKLKLIKRTSLGDPVLTVPLRHLITVRPPKPTESELAADFFGYRIYRNLCDERLIDLGKRGVEGLTLRAGARLPPMMKLERKTADEVYEFDKWRRRMWIAYRHIVVAKKSPNRDIATLAQKYASLLNVPDSDITGLPAVPIVPGTEAPTIEGSTAATPTATAEPEAEPKREPKPGEIETLQPVTRRERPTPTEPPRRRDDPPPRTKTPKPVPGDEAKPVVAEPQDEYIGIIEIPIPSHPRFLTLDDPNVGYGGAFRVSYARVSTLETAKVPAAFISAQVALIPDLGVEMMLPIAFVDLDVERAKTLTTVGNPLIAVKYRLHLPAVLERRPVAMLRARWAIPVSPISTIPPTALAAEDFTLPAHFADTSAFLLEKHAFGLAAATSWELGIVHAGAQLNLDYLSAVQGSLQDSSFFAMGYGGAVGVRPWGDIVGAYLEFRGATLLVGPRRSELFTYLGVRGRFFDLVEPAAWVSLPLGSSAGTNTIQFGGELRFEYDVDGVIVRGTGRRGFKYEQGFE